jgi:hypothetical protein
MLWTLIALGALRGFGPLPDRAGDDRAATTTTAPVPPEPGDTGPDDLRRPIDPAATATASAFLRDYLTIGGDRGAWAKRLKPYLARGVDLGTSVSVPAGTSQYVDYVQPVGTRSVSGGLEVTVLAHLLESRAGAYQEGGLLAFVVPLIRGSRGLAVSGLPRPAPLPITSSLTVRRAALSPEATRDVAAVARRAVAALLNQDRADLAALGGGAPPEARPLPDGWHAAAITAIRAAGPLGEPTAQVLVRARHPTTQAAYLVPVVVSLHSGPDGLFVRRVDAGGMP